MNPQCGCGSSSDEGLTRSVGWQLVGGVMIRRMPIELNMARHDGG
jgi:hypothetical protein